jgi:hypothetical protein
MGHLPANNGSFPQTTDNKGNGLMKNTLYSCTGSTGQMKISFWINVSLRKNNSGSDYFGDLQFAKIFFF